jgi:hypothetical protein
LYYDNLFFRFSPASFAKHGGRTVDIEVDVVDHLSKESIAALNQDVEIEAQIDENLFHLYNKVLLHKNAHL